MRNRLLILLGMALVAMTSFAQWTAPTLENPFEGDVPESGESYVFFNTKAGLFLTGAGYWGTQASLTTEKENTVYPSAFQLEYDETHAGWTFFLITNVIHRDNSSKVNMYMFRAEKNSAFLDMGDQGHNFWVLREQGNNVYRIQTSESDDTYGAEARVDEYPNEFLGWGGQSDDMIVYTDINPATEGVGVDWLIIQQDKYTTDFIDNYLNKIRPLYEAKLSLYELTVLIANENLNVDYSKYAEVYNGTDIDAIKEATAALQSECDLALVYKVLAVGKDGVNPPSETNPCDATSLIKNADFSEGTQWQIPPYWTVEPMGQNNCWNGDSYTNEEKGITVSKFMESWIGAPTTLKDGAMYQTMKALPQGKYTMACDAKVTLQGAELPFDIVGVELFATGGDITTTSPINTPDNKPDHFELTFVSGGGDMTLGLRTRSTNANWMLADNFTLTYYGEIDNPEKYALDQYVSEVKAKYNTEYFASHKANNDTIAALTAVIEKAENAVEDFLAIKREVENAVDAVEASIAAYADYIKQIEEFLAKVEDATEDWPGMGNAVYDVYQEASTSYANGTATNEDIADFLNKSTKAIADYISENVTPGKSVTILLNNPGFDKDQSGWEITNYDGTGKVEAGNHRWGGHNVILPAGFVKEGEVVVAEDETLVSGCNEIWKGAFKYQQTIYNMPPGVYTLSCKGFQRNEDNQSDVSQPEGAAELFAIVGDDVQTQKFANIFGNCSESMLYNGKNAGEDGVAYGGDANAQQEDLNTAAPAEGQYYPNGMCGASAHFAAGYYKQNFDIVVAEASNIIVGARCKATNYWTLFDDFQIVYKGKDAKQLFGTIDNLTSQIENAQENDNDLVLTKDVKTKADAAIAAGIEAKADESDYEKSSDAVKALREALAEVQKNMAFVTEFYKEFAEMDEWRYNLVDVDYYGSLDFVIPDIMEVIRGKLTSEDEAFADSTEIETYRLNMKKAYTAAVMDAASVGSADEAAPANVTAVIYNPNSTSYDVDEDNNYEPYAIGVKGWNVTAKEGVDLTGNGGGQLVQVFQSAFDINQTIYNLTPGFYRLYVNGFYRDGNPARIDSCLNKKEGFENLSYAYLYAGDKETTMLRITNEEDFNLWTSIIDEGIEGISEGNSAQVTLKAVNFEEGELDEDEVVKYMPNNALAANAAFNIFTIDGGYEDMWQNILQFEVKEGQESVTIGIRKEHDANVKADEEAGIEKVEYGDWTIWDNWRLEFVGTKVPLEDPTTTTIKGIENTVAPAKAVIYNVAGQRVAKAVKGLYIINGKKVVVK